MAVQPKMLKPQQKYNFEVTIRNPKVVQMEEKPWDFKAAQPVDYPGCYMFTGTDDRSPEGIFFRKEDGTWWEVVEGKIGDQIVNEKSLKIFRGWYDLAMQSEKRKIELKVS
jgi:hypothetical protein